MESVAIQDREKYFEWEWFRRSDWSNQPASARELFLSACVARILSESSANNCLDYLSGFGRITRELTSLNANMIGYDISRTAITGAKLISSSEGLNIPFFQGYESTILAQTLPHQMSSVFSSSILLEPNWHELRKQFVDIYDIITPGGFFVFVGAGDHKPYGSDLIEEYDKRDSESIEWSFRDGKTLCTKLFIKSNTEQDFRDYKELFIINDGIEARMDRIDKRIPGYWNNHNIRDLTLEVGFCHFETRYFKEDGLEVIFNIAYKDGRLSTEDKAYEEEEAYYDF